MGAGACDLRGIPGVSPSFPSTGCVSGGVLTLVVDVSVTVDAATDESDFSCSCMREISEVLFPDLQRGISVHNLEFDKDTHDDRPRLRASFLRSVTVSLSQDWDKSTADTKLLCGR